MARGVDVAMTAAEKDTVWSQYKAGATCATIGRVLGKPVSTIYSIVSSHGGIAPRRRKRAEDALSAKEREHISRGLAAGDSIRTMAGSLHRAPSTVSREIARNGGPSNYRAVDAERNAWRRARRPKSARLVQRSQLQSVVHAKLRLHWSPEQISGWLAREFPDTMDMRVSHETIYRSLYIQTRGEKKRELASHLRTRRQMRRSQYARRTDDGRGRIVDAVSIAARPDCVEKRVIPGHREGDLISGSKHSHIATLVERRSRYVLLVHVRGKDTTSVVDALIREVQRLPDGAMASLTWDRGMEMAQHGRFSAATGVAVYFCDPKSPWQRGTNENTNGLLRQYYPDGTDLSLSTQAALAAVAAVAAVAEQLNTRPRKKLDFRTPAGIFAEGVAPTS